MRAIKFRAWNKEQRFMHEIFDSKNSTEWFLPNFKERFEIMQYTGLRDKNGKEIYEGDVVACKMTYKTTSLPHMGNIIFEENLGSFGSENKAGITLICDLQLNTLEVMGNLYENPELDAHL